jgi:hypothetical protein
MQNLNSNTGSVKTKIKDTGKPITGIMTSNNTQINLKMTCYLHIASTNTDPKSKA